jgi:hypothetical protein
VELRLFDNNGIGNMTRSDCSILRGLAISSIFLHNYCHLLPTAVIKENEYTFDEFQCIHYIKGLLYNDFLVNTLSFLGHYGVPVFVFLSGYGLVRKYEGKRDNVSPISFIWTHYKKLLSLMIVGFIAYHLIDYLGHSDYDYSLKQVLGQLTFTINMFPNHPISPVPYWYFGLTMEIYIIYRLLLFRKSDIIVLCFAIFCLISQSLFYHNSIVLEWLRYNIFIAGLPLCLGVIYARHELFFSPTKRLAFCLCCIFFIIILVFESYFYLWLFSSIPVILFAISISRLLPEFIANYIKKVGDFSSLLFVIHPTTRMLTLWIGVRYNVYLGLLVYVILTIVVLGIISFIKYNMKSVKQMRS